jgi:hypothetical protein
MDQRARRDEFAVERNLRRTSFGAGPSNVRRSAPTTKSARELEWPSRLGASGGQPRLAKALPGILQGKRLKSLDGFELVKSGWQVTITPRFIYNYYEVSM